MIWEGNWQQPRRACVLANRLGGTPSAHSENGVFLCLTQERRTEAVKKTKNQETSLNLGILG